MTKMKWHSKCFSSVYDKVVNWKIKLLIVSWLKIIWLVELHCFSSMTSIFMSSAYRTKFASWILNGRSFIYTKNNRDPKIEPCSSPCAITIDEDWNLCRLRLLFSLRYFSKLCSVCQIWFKPHIWRASNSIRM